MFGRWFRRSLSAQDWVWRDAAAVAQGLHVHVIQALDAGNAVLLLMRSATDEGDAAHALAARSPVVGCDRFGGVDRLGQRGGLCIGTVASLREPAANTPRHAPLQVHVRGRGLRRSEDRRLLDLLAHWAPSLVVFHHCLDDAPLRAHTGKLKPLLQQLGHRPDEAIVSPFISGAIARVQLP